MTVGKKTLAIALCAFAGFAAAAAGAQDLSSEFDAAVSAPEPATEAKDSNAPSLSLSGDHAFAYRAPAYGDALDYNSIAKAPTAWNALEASYSNGDLKAVLKPNLKWTSWGSSATWELLPSEAYVSWAPDAWKVTVGWKEFAWGVADQRNPTDYLNPRDYRVGTDNRKFPVLSFAAAWYPADWISLEQVYVPYKQSSVFPRDFAANLKSKLAAKGFTTNVQTYESENSPRSGVWGTRANLFFPGVDLSFSYLYDWDTFYTPVIQSMASPAIPPGFGPSSIDLVKKRIHRAGVNAKTTVDRFGLWLETAYNVTEDPNGTDTAVRNNKLAWTAGFDFNFGPSNEYYANLQYAGEWIPGFDATIDKDAAALGVTQITNSSFMRNFYYRSLVQSLGSETEEWLHAWTASVKFPLFDQTVTPSLSGAYVLPVGYDTTNATRYGSVVLKPEIDVMPADSFHILIGADLLYAWVKNAGSDSVVLDTQNDKIGVYTPDNAVYVKVQYKWGSKF